MSRIEVTPRFNNGNGGASVHIYDTVTHQVPGGFEEVEEDLAGIFLNRKEAIKTACELLQASLSEKQYRKVYLMLMEVLS